MNYARSYATTRRSRSVSRNSWRYPHKRRIEKLHFRSRNNYRKKNRSWRGVKTGLIRLGYFFSATTLVAGLSLLLTFGYHFLLTLPYFCLKGPEAIQVTGQQRSQPELVLQQLQIKPGSSLLALQPLKVEAALLRQPWVAGVELQRQWPDRLFIRIKEHQAAAIVQLEELYLMNDRGWLFKALEPQDPHDLPVITGLRQEYFHRPEGQMLPLLTKVFELLEFLQHQPTQELNLAAISEIHVDPESGFTIYPQGLKAGINLGFKDYAGKLANLQKIWPQLQQRHLADIEKVDLNYPNRVLVSLRKAPSL